LNDVIVRAWEREVPWWKKSIGATNNKNEQKTIKKKSGKSKADQNSHQALNVYC
jgi:hypothetical protein